MAKGKNKVYDTADSLKPYVERAMADENLRADVMHAFRTAKQLYRELAGGDTAPVTLATRVATDDDLREKLASAIEDLRSANDRLQGVKGGKSHPGRSTGLLVAGIALGILYNPVTGPETRRFIKDVLAGGKQPGS